MAPPPELTPLRVQGGDFLYKTGAKAAWTRLPPVVENKGPSMNSITFKSGVLLNQRNFDHGSICYVKLILKPPVISIEDDQTTTVEGECVQIWGPTFDAYEHCRDRAKAIEHAKALPLASLDETITVVKLANLKMKMGPQGGKPIDTHEVVERIWALIDRGYRALGTTQPNGSGHRGKKKLWTAEPSASSHSTETPTDKPRVPSSGSTDKSANRVRFLLPPPPSPPPPLNSSTEENNPTNNTRVLLPPPRPQPCPSPSPPTRSPAAPPTTTTTLQQQLELHRIASVEGEVLLRQRMHDERQAMLRAVETAVNDEFDRKVREEVAAFRAGTEARLEGIARGGGAWDFVDGMVTGWRG